MTPDPPRLTAADLRARLARIDPSTEMPELGDHILNPELGQLLDGDAIRDAAVLVPIVDHSDGATVILTTRAATLRKHAGQIAFPGGSVDPTDASPEAAALREAFEEIGLEPAFIETLGRLPRYTMRTGFRITPVVAVVRPGFTLRPNPGEVADVFEVPLAFLMNAANHQRESRFWQGKERFFYVMPFGERYIWGVTAGILRALYERFYA